MDTTALQSERRKQVRLKKRLDLSATAQRYEGRTFHVVKDPINLRYYRFNDQEYFVFNSLDGRQTLEQIQKSFEASFRPDRLSLEDLEQFARQLVHNGLVQHESPTAGRQLFEKRRKQQRLKRVANITNILYIKLPLIDPDRLLNWLYRKTRWIFTNTFLVFSFMFMLAAAGLVLFKFQVFYDKLPAYQEFFRFRTVLYMWISLGIVKIIHEFGHGLSCKAFGGECHQMGFLFMCFSPSMYCNVTDSWTVASKWQRILISFAGIYVELMIAAASTFVWWYTPHWPFVNNIALCLMTLCSVSTFMFNANPLMRFDGYYMLADWLEVPNLREKANRFLSRVAGAFCLGIEAPEEAYMAPWRKWLFVIYAVSSYIYRWVVTFSIVYFLSKWLKPYNLETVSYLLAIASVASMVGWPVYRLIKSTMQRGRLPDMKIERVRITAAVVVVILLAFFLLPLPINRVLESAVVQIQEGHVYQVSVHDPGGQLVQQFVHDGDEVKPKQKLAEFRNLKQMARTESLEKEVQFLRVQRQMIQAQMKWLPKDPTVETNYKDELANTDRKLRTAEENLKIEQQLLKDLSSVEADRGGVVMSSPRQNDMFKFWDKTEAGPFCKIGERAHMRVMVPVGPPQYREIKENLERLRQMKPAEEAYLEASILLPNRSDHIYEGRVTIVPDRHEENVPVALTSRGGGPIATRPSQNPEVNEPIAQTYLIQVEILDPDGTILPGSQAKVKIFLRWRSAAWWVGQKIASALEWGLW
jgi:putative peptide zinc metalloprotease protein